MSEAEMAPEDEAERAGVKRAVKKKTTAKKKKPSAKKATTKKAASKKATTKKAASKKAPAKKTKKSASEAELDATGGADPGAKEPKKAAKKTTKKTAKKKAAAPKRPKAGRDEDDELARGVARRGGRARGEDEDDLDRAGFEAEDSDDAAGEDDDGDLSGSEDELVLGDEDDFVGDADEGDDVEDEDEAFAAVPFEDEPEPDDEEDDEDKADEDEEDDEDDEDDDKVWRDDDAPVRPRRVSAPVVASATPAAEASPARGRRRRKPNTVLDPAEAAEKLMKKPTVVNALNWMRVAEGTPKDLLRTLHHKLETHVWLKEEDPNVKVDLERALRRMEDLLEQ